MTDQPDREKALRIATDYTTAAEAACGERQALADEILALVREEQMLSTTIGVEDLKAKLAASEQALQEAVAQLAGAERLFAGSLAGGERLLDAMRERAEKAERERDEAVTALQQRDLTGAAELEIWRNELTAARARIEALEALLRHLDKWDHMDAAGDGPHWRREIAKALAAQPEEAKRDSEA